MTLLNDNWLFPADANVRAIAQRLYATVRDLPLVSPHGHTEARWFAEDRSFPDPAHLFIISDHYVFRMLYSQGVPFEELGINSSERIEPRSVWRVFAQHYYLFRGTPTRLWLDFVFQGLFGLDKRLSSEKLKTPEFRPRALLERFRVEVLATTDSPLDPLTSHQAICNSPFKGRIIPTFRPDSVVDPDFEGFAGNIASLGQITGEDTQSWRGYLNANEGELFRAQMLTEMARMSLEDGLVMQIHPGSFRNHNLQLFQRYGRDMGADIPTPTDYVRALRPLLDRFGNQRDLTIILFTLDESSYSRELAPLAGHYPCLKLGPAWWFHDSPEGMMRFREWTTDTAGFYNTVGFNDDTRAFLSLPARHAMARRVDCSFLARLVAEHQMEEEEAHELAADLACHLVRRAYKL